jgi:hypothetical protein
MLAPTLEQVVGRSGVRFLGADQYACEAAKWRRERPQLRSVFDELDTYIYELAHPKLFDTSRAEAVLGGPVLREDPLAVLYGGDEPLRRRRLRVEAS